jgi:hypothetical protein
MERKSSHTDASFEESLSRRHETTDAHFKRVLVTGFGLLGIMVAGMLISLGAYLFFKGRTASPGSVPVTFEHVREENLPPKPVLQADPSVALKEMRRMEDSVLASYAWSRKDSGLVQVPIERAMELLVQKGLSVQSADRRK